MTGSAFGIEARLRQALAPVVPPEELAVRLESNLASLVGLAADELEAWELSAMRDPRNWHRTIRPAAAVLVGSGAAVGLVVLRTRRKRHKRRAQAHSVLDLAERTVRDVAREALRVLAAAAPKR